MHHLRQSLFVAAVIGCAASQVGVTFQAPAPAVKVCALLTQVEVRKLIGGSSAIDHLFKPEEEAVAGGSSCNYPDVMIQVIPFRQSTFDTMRKRGGVEAVSGVGEDAYLYDNRGTYAEMYVKVGPHLLTLQRSIGMGQTLASVRSGVIDLAKALVVKLR